MPRIKFLNVAKGFASRTFAQIKQTPYLDFLPYAGQKHRSPVTQRLIIEDLEGFQSNEKKPSSPTLWALTRAHVSDLFRLPEKVKMLHLDDVFQDKELDIWSKSPGLPWKEWGFKTKGEIRDNVEARDRVKKLWSLVKQGHKIELPDCCAYVRSHICDQDETKVRAVWGYPATVTFGEAMFAIPLIKAYQSQSRPSIAYTYEAATGGFKRLVTRFYNAGKYYYGIDFKQFDKRVPAWIIEEAFDILASNIDFGNYKDGPCNARSMIHMFDVIRAYFIRTKIRTAQGLRFQKFSGVASGSYFTQLIDSVINALICTYLFMLLTGNPPMDAVYFGDDSLISSNSKLPLFEIARILFEEFEMILNIDKTTFSENLGEIKFLGYQINCGFPIKPFDDWMASLLFPERPDDCWDDVQSRALGLYYANMCMDDKFSKICYTLIKFRAFDLSIPRDMERKLKYMGYERADVNKEPPGFIEFYRKLAG